MLPFIFYDVVFLQRGTFCFYSRFFKQFTYFFCHWFNKIFFLHNVKNFRSKQFGVLYTLGLRLSSISRRNFWQCHCTFLLLYWKHWIMNEHIVFLNRYRMINESDMIRNIFITIFRSFSIRNKNCTINCYKFVGVKWRTSQTDLKY